MKIHIKLLLFATVFILSSCESWLDLKPITQATEEQIFSTAEGYRSTLNGLYKNMGKASLYGKNLAFAMLDGFSQQYDLSPENNVMTEYQAYGKMDYGQTQVASRIEETWLAAYNVVANANNLIQNLVENTTPELFEFGEMERNMILGEAYACRALVQFDMLRLFAPAPISDDGANYVPYVEQYPNIQPAGISVNECIDKVIADLEKAKELAAKKGYLGIYTQAQDNNLSACLFYLNNGFRIGGLDTEIYNGTNQEGKADILFYLDLFPRGGFVPPVAAVEKDPAP